jgi:F-type H+-transporting ATPase subunit gamma
VQPSPLAAAPPNARSMATLREIELRLKSVKNIEKITKVAFSVESSECYLSNVQSMKMIASTKLARAQRAMVIGKQYGIANSGVYFTSTPPFSINSTVP